MVNKIKELLKEKNNLEIEQIETHKCRIMGLVNTLEITYPNGFLYKKAVVHKEVGGACVLPVTKDNDVFLEIQYRFPLREALLELPAGRLDEGENFSDCAVRELREETGCTSDNIIEQYDYFAQAEFTDERIGTSLALNSVQNEELDLDFDELVDVIKMPFSTAKELVKRNIITDARTIIGIGLTEMFLDIPAKEIIEDEINKIINRIKDDEEKLKEEDIDIDYTYPCEFGFVQDHIIKTSNMKNSRRECMYMQKGRFVIPVSADGKIGVRVKYMPAVRKNCIELPEKAEFKDEELKYMGSMVTAVGYTNDRQEMYLAENCSEKSDLLWINDEEIKILIKDRIIEDGKVLAGILKYYIDKC